MKHLQLFMHAAFTALQPVFVGRAHEGAEQWVRLQRLGLEFRMELAAQKIRMVGHLYYLNVSAVRRAPSQPQPAAGQDGLILAVEFITMAMAFADLRGPIGAGGKAAGLQLA